MRAARLQCLLPCTLPLPHQQPRRLCRIVIAKRLQGSNAHVVGAPPTSRYLYDGCGVTPLLANRIGNNHRGHAAGTTTAMTAAVGCPGRANFSTESSLLVSTKKSRWVGVASAAGLAAVVAIYQTDGRAGGEPAAAAEAQGRTLPLPRYAVADAVEAASPWVVNVIAGLPGAGGVLESDEEGLRATGSGFLISSDGLVVTNAHVVERFVDGVVVITLDGGERLQGKVQAIDRKSDLALLKCDVPKHRDPLPVADIGNSLALRAGDFVVALGSPGGLANTCTLGIVSATARPRSDLVEDARTATMIGDSTEFIQTDAAINSGNSGGPLIDLDGRVIGINTLKLQGAEGLGFAIPIDTAWQIVTELRMRGRVDRPQLGMRLVAADPGHERGRGVMVLSVTPGGAADAAGLRFGDLITEFDGKSVAKTSDVLQCIGREVGRRIEIVVRRDGQPGSRGLTVVTESDLISGKPPSVPGKRSSE